MNPGSPFGKRIRLALFGIALLSPALHAQTLQGPGGLNSNAVAGTNIGLWLDASSIPSTSTTVTRWADRSSRGHSFTSTTGATYIASAQNGKPALQFNGTNQYFESVYSALLNPAAMTLYVVSMVETGATYKSPITSRNDNSGYMIYSLPTSNTWDIWYGLGTGGHNYEAFTSGWQTTNAWSIMTYTIGGGRMSIYRNNNINNPNGAANTINATYGPNTSRPTRVGAGNTDVAAVDFFFKGRIGDIAIYPAAQNEAQRMIINNALAWKYNIALTAGYAVTGAPAGYSNDVGGIGKGSDGTAVTTALTVDLLQMTSASTSLDNNEYMFWGHDGGAMVATATGIPTRAFSVTTGGVTKNYTVQGRLTRIWKALERSTTGTTAGVDVGTLSIQVNLATVPGAKRLEDLVLLVDRNNNGFADETYTAASSSGIFMAAILAGGNVVTFNDVNLKEGDAFTVGTLNIIQTPLPVTLLNLTAAVTKERHVALQWQTATEQHSHYFSIERSTDGTNWTSIDTVAAAGESTSRLTYNHTDAAPPSGRIYYRIRSVDIDGAFSYSDMVTAIIPTTFKIYPNPAAKELFIETEQAANASEPIVLTDPQGMFHQVMAEKDNDNRLRLDISSLKPGVYGLKVGQRWNRIVIL